MPKLNLKPNWRSLGPTSNCLVQGYHQLPSVAQLPIALCGSTSNYPNQKAEEKKNVFQQYSRAAILFCKEILNKLSIAVPLQCVLKENKQSYRLENKKCKKKKVFQQYSRAAILFIKRKLARVLFRKNKEVKKQSVAGRLYS